MNITIPLTVTAVHISIISVIAFIIMLIIPLGGFVVGLVTFTYAYLPLPALAIWSSIFSEQRKMLGSIVSLFTGLLGTYFLLLIVTPDNVEVIGGTTIVRHAGPSLNQAYEIESYMLPIIIMAAAVKLYWFVLVKEVSRKET